MFNQKNIIFLFFIILMNSYFVLTVSAESIPEDFDHDDTNFLLSGAHLTVECNNCHVQDVYQGLPVSCEECHSASSLLAKTKKPANHFESADTCDNCHTVETWGGARIDHESVVGSCIDCHNNVISTGRTEDHIQSVDDCKQCHTTRQWKQFGFDHSVITGNCYSCHNGTTAKGKPEKHRLSTNQCADCHQVKNWKHKAVNHKELKTGCLECHLNVVPGLPHPKGDKCELCHSPAKKWQQIRFKHEKTAEFCVTCHKNAKLANHFILISNEDIRCDECHRSITSWISNVRFDHEVIDFREHRSNTNCTVCHLSNSRIILWRFASHRPRCAGCHAAKFNTATHTKAPGLSYTLSELSNCSGACHFYTDNSFSNRVNNRNRNANYHTTLRGRGIGIP